jgi:glutathione S-transferase
LLVLRSSPFSPFGRKVKITAALLGLSDRFTVVMADTQDPEDNLRQQNPLGKIPALLLEDGRALYDSRVIVEYLDHLAGGGRVIPALAEARFEALTLQALADGIVDAAILQVYEKRFRDPAGQSANWLSHQRGKVERGLEALEKGSLPALGTTPAIGAIALACALGYLDLRFDGWRVDYPRLAGWVGAFEQQVPAFTATRPPAS